MQYHVERGAFTGDGLTKYIPTDAKLTRYAKFGRTNRFEVKNETEDQGQSIPKSIGTLTVLRCIFGPNMEVEVLTSIGGDLWRGQTHKLQMG